MFWGQPSMELIWSLKRVGLVADSSVVGGLYATAPVPTDYRNIPSSAGYWWTSNHDISRSGPKGENIIEFPIYSRLQPYLFNFKWTKLSATLKRGAVEKANIQGHGMMNARKSTESLGGIIKRLWTQQPLKFDFCKLSARDMIRWLERLINGDRMVDDRLGTIVVMLGHSKDFWNDKNFELFLKHIQKEHSDRIRFCTFAEVTKWIMERVKPNHYEKTVPSSLLSSDNS
jgi:hypothetical protein